MIDAIMVSVVWWIVLLAANMGNKNFPPLWYWFLPISLYAIITSVCFALGYVSNKLTKMK